MGIWFEFAIVDLRFVHQPYPAARTTNIAIPPSTGAPPPGGSWSPFPPTGGGGGGSYAKTDIVDRVIIRNRKVVIIFVFISFGIIYSVLSITQSTDVRLLTEDCRLLQNHFLCINFFIAGETYQVHPGGIMRWNRNP